MMSTLRKNTAMVLWILVFAFIATIIFSWGMGGFRSGAEPGVVAEVNGEKLMREQFDNTLQNQLQMEREQAEEELRENDIRRIRQQVWEQLIADILIRQRAKEHDIIVTDYEVAQAVRNNPPAQIRSNPQFQDSTGAFNWPLYRQVIADPQYRDFVIALEQQMRSQIRQNRVLQRLTSPSYVSVDEAKQAWEAQNTIGQAAYLVAALSRMEVDSSLVTDEQLRAAYERRIEEFRLEPTRTVEAIVIPDVPSREDTVEALRLAERVAEQARAGEDFGELASEYSDDPSAGEGGDLGWFSRGRMTPDFEEAVLSGEVGEIVGPVLTRYGYHVIKVEGRRGSGETLEMKASHVLVRIVQSVETQDNLRSLAEGFREEAEESGFHEAARVYGFEIDTLENVRDNGLVPRLGRNYAATSFIFNRPVGTITPVYTSRSGYYVLHSLEAQPASYQPFEEVRASLLRDAIRELQYQRAEEHASAAYQQVGEMALASLGKRHNMLYQETEREFKVGSFVSGLGRDFAFQLAALNQEVGDISEPVKGEKGYYIIQTTALTTPDTSQWSEVRDRYIQQLNSQRQQLIYNRWLDLAMEEADIEDFRYLYYTKY